MPFNPVFNAFPLVYALGKNSYLCYKLRNGVVFVARNDFIERVKRVTTATLFLIL